MVIMLVAIIILFICAMIEAFRAKRLRDKQYMKIYFALSAVILPFIIFFSLILHTHLATN